MLAGVNDAPATAHELGALLTASPHTLLVNLIPWNPVFSPGMAFAAPDPARVAAFGVILREQYGLFTTVRQEMGQARPTAAPASVAAPSGLRVGGGVAAWAACRPEAWLCATHSRSARAAVPAAGRPPVRAPHVYSCALPLPCTAIMPQRWPRKTTLPVALHACDSYARRM